MTREEIIKKIDELDRDLFRLQMKDTWNGADYERERRLERQIRDYKKMLDNQQKFCYNLFRKQKEELKCMVL